MNFSWQLYWLWCSYDIFMGLLVAGNEDTLQEFKPAKLVPEKFEQVASVTESFLRKKNTLLQLKNNNILRDKNTQPINQDTAKSVLAGIMKNTSPSSYGSETVDLNRGTEISDQQTINQNKVDISDTNSTTEGYSLDILPRNTRDLIYDSLPLNNNETEVGNISIKYAKEQNSSFVADDDSTNSTEKSKLPEENGPLISQTDPNVNYHLNRNRTTLVNKFPTVQTTPLSSLSKNPKDKENKTKGEMTPKPMKKLPINVKNKSGTSILNVTTESTRSKNLTEFSNEIPSNESLPDTNTKNATWLSGQVDEDKSNNITTSSLKTVPESEGLQTLDMVLIGVAVIAVVSIVTAVGMFSVILYRRYHWNKPQTFSDKCSNADSTGYIDDSTLKENSEEMYSLDNDSFLNSLEAMTIQNYWADSIRHTKL